MKRTDIIKLIQENPKREELRIEELLKELRKDSEFKSLEEAKDGLSFEIAKLESQNEDIENLKKEFETAKGAFEKKINALGHQMTDLEIKYKCNICKDKGLINNSLCVCAKNIMYQVLTDNCGKRITDKKALTKDLANIIDKEYKEKYLKAVTKLKEYAEKFPNVKTLILSGSVGVGKTFLATVIANNLMAKGYSVWILDSFRMNEIFLEYHLCSLDKKRETFAPLLDCDLLVIDDLGSENLINNVTKNYLLELLAVREKPIIVTTNLNNDSIKCRYEDRIFSRLCGANICEIMPFNEDKKQEIKGVNEEDLRNKIIKGELCQ